MDTDDIWKRLTESSKLALGYAAAYQRTKQYITSENPAQLTQQTVYQTNTSQETVSPIFSENILRGLIAAHQGSSEPEQLVEYLKLPLDAIEAGIETAGGFIPDATDVKPIHLSSLPKLSRNSQAIVENSLKNAERYNPEPEKLVRIRDLFGGILLVKESMAYKVLAQILQKAGLKSITQIEQTYPSFLSGDSSLSYAVFLQNKLALPDKKDAIGKEGFLSGHQGDVNALAVTPDGRLAISGSTDKTLKVWDLRSGKEIATLSGHHGAVYALAVTPDGRRVVSGSADKTLKVWDLGSGKEIGTLSGHQDIVSAVAVTSDSRLAISGSTDKTLKVWDLGSGKEIGTLTGHQNAVKALVVTPDGRRVVSGSADQTLKVWDLQSGKEISTFAGHHGDVYALAVTPDGRRAISGSADKTLKVWDLQSGKEIGTLRGHQDVVSSVAVTPDGRRAVSGSADKTLKVWDLESGEEIGTLTGHQDFVQAVTVTPDGKRAISGSYDQTLRVWDLTNLMPIKTVISASVLADHPLYGKEDIERPDPLGYAAYAGAIFQLITKDDTKLPISIAISAPWGYGKTSTMRWIKTELDLHREGEEHRCKVIPGLQEWPARQPINRIHSISRLFRRQSDHSGSAQPAAQAEEHARRLGLTRHCKTVWIDAWKFESSASLWAAFTKEIYQQTQQQMKGSLERLKFRLALANTREQDANSGSWKAVIWAVLKNRWATVVAVLAGIAAGFAGFKISQGVLEYAGSPTFGNSLSSVIAAVTGLSGCIGGLVTWARGWIRQPFSFDLNKVTAATRTQPEPVDEVNIPGDIERLIRLLAQRKDEGLVVFIDDLDRCSPVKVKDAVEAINLLFNSSPLANTVFVLGMDEVMVAASLHVAYSDMIRELQQREHPASADFGHRFLSKICQLSFDLPEPQSPAMEEYLNGLMETSRKGNKGNSKITSSGTPVLTVERKNEIDKILKGKNSVSARMEAAEDLISKASEVERDSVAEVVLEKVKEENLRVLTSDSPEVQKAIREGVKILEPRPRDYKRYINAVRLQLLVANQSLKLDQSRKRATISQIAKWTAIGIRWPILAEELRKHPELINELEQWAKNGKTPLRPWQKRIDELMKDPAFKKAFRTEPQLGKADLHGLLIVQ
jgi:WD40 repeat protein